MYTAPICLVDMYMMDTPFWRLQFKAALTEIQKRTFRLDVAILMGRVGLVCTNQFRVVMRDVAATNFVNIRFQFWNFSAKSIRLLQKILSRLNGT